ncbi:MAG: tetratricopeptide repeat protein [Bacteroidota bacterium]
MKAQSTNIDSLLTLLKKDKADTNKINHLNQLTRELLIVGSYDTAILCGEAALSLGKQFDFKKGIANSNGTMGLIYLNKCEYSKALSCFFTALEIDEELGDKIGMEKRFCNIGVVYQGKGDSPKAVENYLKALKIAEELGDKKIQAFIFNNIGNVYRDKGETTKALNNYLESLKIAEKILDKQMQASILCNIGLIYQQQKELTTAIDCYFKGLKISKELDNKYLISIIFGNIGNVYKEAGETTKALDYFSKSLKMAEKLGDKQGIAIKSANIGSLYINSKNYVAAEKFLIQALTIDTTIGFLSHAQFTHEELSRLFEIIGKPAKALDHYKKAMVVKDTLFYADKNKEIIRKTMNYEFEKKEAITKAENEKQQVIAEEKNRKQKIITWSVAFGLLLVLLFAGFIFRSLRITRKQKLIIEIKSKETEQQKKIIEEKNKDITDSIHYAKRIQHALLRDEEHTSMHLPEHFILFMPKDIVSGDFYWGAEKNEYWYFAAVDCTGHGVPGAVMSMLGVSFLNDILSIEGLPSPAEILNRLRNKIIKELRQTGEADGNKDGMDISLARLNLKTNELEWAGANNSLNLIRNGQLGIVKADKQPIGYHPNSHSFTNHKLQLKKGDSIYLYSDGYADQFGGPKGKKFKYKQLDDLIMTYKLLPMGGQKELLKKHFAEWKGGLEQVDDVCVFGVRV